MKYSRLVWLLLAGLALLPSARANQYTVTSTGDGVGSITALGGTNYNASTLRAATAAATIAGGGNLINVPAGTYTLSLGELVLGVTAGASVIVNGTGTVSNTIIQHDTNSAAARVFDVDSNLVGNISVTFQNVTIAHGRNTDGNGGAGVICGFQSPPDTNTFINCSFLDNQVIGAAADAVGGAIQNIGGTLTVSNCTFLQNSATNFSGGAIYYDSHSPSTGTCMITASAFSNNVSGDLADGGGAVFISAVTNSTLAINNSSFVNNRVISASGSGGAILKNGTALLTVTGCTFLMNQVLGNTTAIGSAAGGAMDIAGGAANIQFCRFYGNVANLPSHGNTINCTAIAATSFAAVNNWWAANSGPSANDLVGATTPIWLKLVNYANPATIVMGGTSALTASFVTNSAGTAIALSNLGTLIGLPIVFNTLNGNITLAQSNIQASATATATFTHTAGIPANINAVVDGAAATAVINVLCSTTPTATLGGGGNICPGNSAVVTVTLTSGVPPYSVTLSGGGGSTNKSGASPLQFVVSPPITTSYTISSATDANGCPATISGSATVTVNTVTAPTISLMPANVVNRSSGNLATGPSGLAGYSWSITNGTITSPANQASITYTAGKYGDVGLTLTVANVFGCTNATSVTVPSMIVPVVSLGCDLRSNYFNSLTFTDALPTHPAGMAFDGTNYWACTGVNAGGARIGKYDTNGILLTNYAPGVDIRSIFTDSNGVVYIRGYTNNTIYRQTSPGVLASTGITLNGGSLDGQAQVVLNGAGNAYIAMNAGIVYSWSLNGSFLGSVALQGYGLPGENTYPQNRAIGAVGEFWVTYNTNGAVVSVWETNGVRIGTTKVLSGGATFDSGFGFSYCNGKVFVPDVNGGLWRAYDVCDAAQVAIFGAPSTTNWNADVKSKVTAVGAIPRVDAFLVLPGYPVPTITNFEKYEAVLVYSDGAFNDATTIGSNLYSYVALGGGVTVSSFGFLSPAGTGLGGQITNGYLPFTPGANVVTSNSLVLVTNLAAHPLLDGVASFNGGLSSYHESVLTINPGAALVASWPDGQPLVGGKDVPPGRTAGLNFYPPSSDARYDFWVNTSDGDRLMSDALLWSGKIPPTISEGPANQYQGTGQPVTFSVTAAGTPPLTYQWRFNGTNIAGATNKAYTLLAQPGNEGVYRAVVSNSYGASFSPAAMLNPGLRFLAPALTGQALSLYLGNTDGSAISPALAARIQFYSSVNAAAPKASWTLMNNPVVLTNGLLRVDGLQVTNTTTFFIAKLMP